MYRMNDINELYQELSDNRQNFNSIIPDLFNRTSALHRDGIQNLFMKILSNLVVSIPEFKLMVDLGADPSDSNFYAFDMVAMTNKMELAKYIIDNYDINLQDHQAYLTDCVGGMKYEIFQLVYPDAESITDRIIKNCLHDLEKVKLLVSYGIDVERIINICESTWDYIPGNCIAIGKYLIEILVQTSPQIIPHDKNLCFVLNNCLASGVLEKKLIEQLDSLGFDFKQNELLENVCKHHNNLEIIVYFINEGYYNDNNGSALTTAIKSSCKDIVKLLLDHNIIITDEAIQEAVIQRNETDFLILLHQHGVTLDRITDCFKNFLHNHCYTFLPVLKFLAENDVDLNRLVLDR